MWWHCLTDSSLLGSPPCCLCPRQSEFQPFMVVSPLAVVDNWEREFKIWCPEMDIIVYKGSQVSQ